jgi:hypothetical protein
MKKVLTFMILLAALCIANILHAQSSMTFRITGGLNFAYVKEVPPITEAASHLGYMLGINGNLGSHVFFQPGLQFASIGSAIEVPGQTTTGDVRHEFRANYIRVPVQVGLRLIDPSSALGISPFNVEVRGGVSGSYLVGFTDRVSAESEPKLDENNIRSLRTAFVVGAGVRLAFLSLGLEYEHAINTMFINNSATKVNVLYIVFGGYL